MDIKKFKNLNILFVEDEVELQNTVSLSLKTIVQDIVFALNGKEGLEKLQANNIDLIITDLEMPTMDGLDMIKEIRKTNQEIPILVTTACGDKNSKVKELEIINNCIYVMKPVDMMKLVKSIYSLIDG